MPIGKGDILALVELNGPEVPVTDGSAQPFVSLIERLGTVEQAETRRVIWIRCPITVHDGDKFAVLMSARVPRITVEIVFKNQVIGQ